MTCSQFIYTDFGVQTTDRGIAGRLLPSIHQLTGYAIMYATFLFGRVSSINPITLYIPLPSSIISTIYPFIQPRLGLLAAFPHREFYGVKGI
jgi:hypothetical protein